MEERGEESVATGTGAGTGGRGEEAEEERMVMKVIEEEGAKSEGEGGRRGRGAVKGKMRGGLGDRTDGSQSVAVVQHLFPEDCSEASEKYSPYSGNYVKGAIKN